MNNTNKFNSSDFIYSHNINEIIEIQNNTSLEEKIKQFKSKQNFVIVSGN